MILSLRIWFLLSICLSASLIGPAMLQDTLEESSESNETRDLEVSAEEVLNFLLDKLNDYFSCCALTSIPVKEKLYGKYLYGSKVWGIHLGKASGEVKRDASIIVVNMEFPYLQFTLFADVGDDEGIVIVKLYNLNVRSVVYFNDDLNTFPYMDSYIRSYTLLMIENADGDKIKDNLVSLVDINVLQNLLKEAINEILKIYDYIRPTEADYSLRNIVRNRTYFQNLRVAQPYEM